MSALLEQLETTNIVVANKPRRRLLLVAYNFPPVGGAGVQRPVKWVKNLRQLGWDVTVLTTENPSVPVRDESLLADIPEDVLVLRARTWEPDYQVKQGITQSNNTSGGIVSAVKSFAKGLMKRVVKLMLQPDPQVLWVPNAIRAGRQILRELNHDVILVTAPAYSSFFIGTALKRQFGLPLVLDFRDEWDLSGKYLENAHRDVLSQVVQRQMQRHVLKKADAVVATTMASTSNLAGKLRSLNRTDTPAVTVYNGFDAEDFSSEPETAATTSDRHDLSGPKRFRLLYTGTLWNLTTIEPLVEAVLSLSKSDPELVDRLELVCVGRKTPDQSEILSRLKPTGCRLELIDYCEHSKVLEWLGTADAVCLLLSDVPGADRVVPAKLFEYFASRKDMLAIVPNGETAQIIQQVYPSGAIEPKNVGAIATWLQSRLSREFRFDARISRSADIDKYSRLTQTKRLVELLDGLVHSNQRSAAR